MKKQVVIIGHTYTVSSNRDKVRHLARHEDFQVHLIVPEKWAHQTAGLQIYQGTDEDHAYTTYPLPVFKSGNNKRFLFRGIYGVLWKIRPDIIHLDEEPFNRVTLQVVLFARLFLRHARIVLFTWENIFKKFKIHYRLLERFNINHADMVLCGNQEAKSIMEKKGAKARLLVMPQYGVDLETYHKSKKRSSRIRVGFIGRLVPEKGVLDLVAAFLRLPFRNKMLYLIGSGPLSSSLPRTSFLKTVNWVHGSKVPEYLRNLDVLVLPSYEIRNWKEQFGHILIEAMAAGVAVIGSDSGEIPHVIKNAGLIFKQRDVDDLYDKLSILFRNKDMIRKYSGLGHERVRRFYTNEVLTRETIRMYHDLLK